MPPLGYRKPPIIRHCVYCDTTFEVTWRVSDNKKYCSPECQSKARRKRISIICAYCGKTFERILARSNDKYCSARCGFDAKIKQVDMDIIASRYLSGEDSPAIAKSLNVSPAFIARRLKTAGVELRPNFAHLLKNNPTKGKGHTPEAREKIKAARRRQFGTPENESRQMSEWAIARIIEGRTGKAYNKLEKAFAALLDSADIAYQQQYRLGRFIFDFYLPTSHTLVEVHGTYWHADPRFYDRTDLYSTQTSNLANDERKRQRAIDDGYNYLSFWEFDIYHSPTTVIADL